MAQFDPNFPGLFEGDITNVAIIDPIFAANNVIDSNQQFDIKVAWKIFGEDVPTRLGAAENFWNVAVYAESIGASPDVLLGNANVNKNNSNVCVGTNCTLYEATITVPPGTLLPHVSGSLQTGIYKILASVFLNSNNAGGDAIGFREGPVIQVEPL
ncbi:MAG: hypothetical protein ACRDRP_12735 [Pseudonocardiaceae bacterium]